MAVTNQQILLAIGEIKADVTNLKSSQDEQGKKILEILLRNSKKDGEETANREFKNRRKSDKVILWTAIASLGTGLLALVGVVTLVMMYVPKSHIGG